MPNARSRGPSPPDGLNLIQWRSNHARLVQALRGSVEIMAARGLIEPVSARIVGALGFYHVAPAALLAWTRCRWAELGLVELPDVIESRRVHIIAAKGSEDRWSTPLPREAVKLWQHVPPSAPLTIASYDSVCERLALAREFFGIQLPTGCHTGTHLFRHLWASWRLSEGDSLEAIAKGLGHRSLESTRAYCHDYQALFINQLH